MNRIASSTAPAIRHGAMGCAFAAAGIALCSWLGWGIGQPQALAFGATYVPMAPLTALALILLSVGVALRRQSTPRPAILALGAAANGVVALIALLALAYHLRDLSMPLEHWLARTSATVAGIPLGRMAPSTASLLLAAAAALSLQFSSRLRHQGWQHLAGGLALAVLVASLVVALGYASGTPLSYDHRTIPMALTTALAFIPLSAGLLLPIAAGLWWPALTGTATHPLLVTHGARRTRGILWLLFVLLGGAIGSAGLLGLKRFQAKARQDAEQALRAIADLKVAQIVNWREERLRESRFVSQAAFVARDVAALLAQPSSAAAPGEILGWLRQLRGQGNRYDQVALFDAAGRELLAAVPWQQAPGSLLREHLATTLREGKVWMTDLQRADAASPAYIELLCPIFPPSPAAGAAPSAVLLFRIDPRRFLYPLIQAWPTPSPTAETVLVRREGNEVVYLNELRHRPGAERNLRFPLNDPVLPAARAFQGTPVLAEGRDYRGVPVVTAFRAVPDSPWLLGAKMDQAEIFAPLRRQALATGGIVACLFLAAMLGVGLLWRKQDATHLRRELALERERNALSERLAAITRHAHDMILLTNQAGRIVEANDRALSAYGYSLEELGQLSPDGVLPLTAPAGGARPPANADPAGTVFETEHHCKDGTRLPVEVSRRTIEFAGQRFVLGICRDISDRKRNDRRLQQLIEVIQKLAMARDLATVMTAVRSAARHLTGADGATFVLRDGDQCFYADEDAIGPLWKGQRFPMSQCISGWVMTHHQAAIVPDIYADPRIPADAYRPTFVQSLAMVPIHGLQSLGAIGNYWAQRHTPAPDEMQLLQVLADATAISLQNIQHLAELEQRVRARTAALEAANQELEAFSYSVSHDLRAPLRTVDGFSQAVLSDFGSQIPAEARRYLELIRTGAQRMGVLIDDLLDFARLSRMALHQSPVDMAGLVRDCLADLEPEQRDRRVEIRVGDLPPTVGDPALLKQVWMNLISNALKFTRGRDPAVIEIHTHREHAEAVYVVRDNGSGFDMAYAHKLFGVFQRLHPIEDFPGTGVGLAIVQRVIHRHGGRVWADARVDHGATFSFTLGPESP